MTRMTKYTAAAALALVLSACDPSGGGAHHVEGKELQNLDKQVSAKFKSAAWQSHIKRIHKGLLGISINTDYDAGAPGTKQLAVAICDAYVKTSPVSPFIKVYAVRTHTETKVDGSKKTSKTDEQIATTTPAGLLDQPGDPDYGDGDYKDKCSAISD